MDKPTHVYRSSVGGIVAFLVGQIAALGPNPAGSRTDDLMTLLHAALDPLASPVAAGSAEKHTYRMDSSGEFDEAFIRNASIHVERMDEMCYWIGIDPVDGPSVNIRTGVQDGVWFFRLEEDSLEESPDFVIQRSVVPEGWVKVTPETMPRTGAACLIVWSGRVQNALYRRVGIGFACAGGYEWRHADDDEADAIPDAEVEFWKPRPPPPAAEEERSSL